MANQEGNLNVTLPSYYSYPSRTIEPKTRNSILDSRFLKKPSINFQPLIFNSLVSLVEARPVAFGGKGKLKAAAKRRKEEKKKSSRGVKKEERNGWRSRGHG